MEPWSDDAHDMEAQEGGGTEGGGFKLFAAPSASFPSSVFILPPPLLGKRSDEEKDKDVFISPWQLRSSKSISSSSPLL